MRRRFFLKSFMCLLGTVSKRLHVSRHVKMQVLLCRLHQFQDLLFSESLAVFWAVVQEIGQPSLDGNGAVAISKKRLSQLGVVMNRTTDHATIKVCFKADQQGLLKKRCTKRRSVSALFNEDCPARLPTRPPCVDGAAP